MIEVNETQQAEKLRRGKTRCIRLSCNGVNDKKELNFNAHDRVCSKNASTFASWCGCMIRKKPNALSMVEHWKDIPKDLIDYQQKMLQLVSVSCFSIYSIYGYVCCYLIVFIFTSDHVY